MGDHLKETGKALVMDPERQKEPVEWVQRLLQVGAVSPSWLPPASPACSATE